MGLPFSLHLLLSRATLFHTICRSPPTITIYDPPRIIAPLTIRSFWTRPPTQVYDLGGLLCAFGIPRTGLERFCEVRNPFSLFLYPCPTRLTMVLLLGTLRSAGKGGTIGGMDVG